MMACNDITGFGQMIPQERQGADQAAWWIDFLADAERPEENHGAQEEESTEYFDNTVWPDSDRFKPIIVKYLESAVTNGNLLYATRIIEPWKASRSIFASALTCAVDNQRPEFGSWLLEEGVTPNKYHYQYAMKKEALDFLELYLDYGFDVNEIWNPHTTPLDHALHCENLTRWLLAHGANPHLEDDLKSTPLSRAVGEAGASLAVIRILFEHDARAAVNHGYLLHCAICRDQSDRIEIVEYLLSKGALSEINKLHAHDGLSLDGMSQTPLHRAAGRGNMDVVKLLVSRGANPLILDGDGRLAVEVARQSQRNDIAEYLASFQSRDSKL